MSVTYRLLFKCCDIFVAGWRHSLVRHAIADLDTDEHLGARTLINNEENNIVKKIT
jgi:hypothetical protein